MGQGLEVRAERRLPPQPARQAQRAAVALDLRQMNPWSAFVSIALGGAAGSVVRAAVALALPSRFPWAILLVNVAGSLLIGWLMARLGGGDDPAGLRFRALLITGF